MQQATHPPQPTSPPTSPQPCKAAPSTPKHSCASMCNGPWRSATAPLKPHLAPHLTAPAPHTHAANHATPTLHKTPSPAPACTCDVHQHSRIPTHRLRTTTQPKQRATQHPPQPTPACRCRPRPPRLHPLGWLPLVPKNRKLPAPVGACHPARLCQHRRKLATILQKPARKPFKLAK